MQNQMILDRQQWLVVKTGVGGVLIRSGYENLSFVRIPVTSQKLTLIRSFSALHHSF